MKTGSITLWWDAPTHNMDGSPIVEPITGYHVFYGPVSVTAPSGMTPTRKAKVTLSLPIGEWSFSVTTIANGVEGPMSKAVVLKVGKVSTVKL